MNRRQALCAAVAIAVSPAKVFAVPSVGFGGKLNYRHKKTMDELMALYNRDVAGYLIDEIVNEIQNFAESVLDRISSVTGVKALTMAYNNLLRALSILIAFSKFRAPPERKAAIERAIAHVEIAIERVKAQWVKLEHDIKELTGLKFKPPVIRLPSER